MGIKLKWISLLLSLVGTLAYGQQPQVHTGTPFAVNAKYTNGVAPGYWATAGAGLVLNISAGRVRCVNTMMNYTAGTLTMTNSTTNYVYLDTASSCAPGSNTTGYTASLIPLATVVTSGGAITSITDDRTLGMSTAAGSGSGVTTTGSPASPNLTCFSGAATITNCASIPDGTPLAGSLLATNIAAPSSPASGKVSLFSDSTDLRFHDKNASGVIGTTVVADTGASNNFLTAISAAGVITKAQPTLANIAAGAAPSGTFDFSGVTILKGRFSAGLTTSTNGDFGYDTTNKNWHLWTNGADKLGGIWSATPTNGNCVQASVSSSVVTLADTGSPCGTGSGSVTTTGSPATGNLTKFSGAASITNADLSGDCTTSGALATTCGKLNGGTVPTSANLIATNGSAQPVAATADNISLIVKCVAASASGTAYTCSTSPTFVPAAQDAIRFKADVANIGSATLNVNSSSAATIKKQGGGTNLVANDLLAGQWVSLIFDGTNWQMQGQTGNAAAGGLSSVGLTMPSGEFTVSGSPLVANGTIAVTKASESANLIAAGPANGANTSIVQHAQGVCDGCGGASITVAYPSSNTAGNLLIAVGTAFGFTGGGLPTDTVGDTFVAAGADPGSGVNMKIWYVCSAIGGANSVTLAGGRSLQLHIYEVTGNATSTCNDRYGSIGSSSSTAAFSVATSTNVSQANEFVITAYNTNFSSTTSLTMGTGYTQQEQSFGSGTASGNVTLMSGQGNANSGLSGVQTSTATGNVAAGFWNGIIATFKLNTAGSSAPWTFRTAVCADLPTHVPCPIVKATQTGKVAAITDTTMTTAPSGGQLYRFTGALNCTTSSAAATATLNLKYTDTSSTAQTLSATATCTTLGAASIANMVNAIRAKAATAITYGVTIANTPTYDVDLTLEQMQ